KHAAKRACSHTREDHMKFWRIFFGLVAAFNLLTGAVLVFGGDAATAQFGISGAASPFVLGLIGLFLIVFGLGFAMAAWRAARNRTILALGAIVKASAVVLASYHAYAGHISHGTYMSSMIDLVVALLIALYLRQTRKAATPT